MDFNGDGDTLDAIRFYTPNNTNTHRIGLTSSLIWDISPDHRVRVAYTLDRAHHRQTGEWGFLESGGDPESPFSGRNATPVLNATGFQIQQRNRTSIALLNQIAGQWIGKFFDQKLRVEVGVRRPFFKRDLNTLLPDPDRTALLIAPTNRSCRAARRLLNQPGGAPTFSIPIFVNLGDAIPSTADLQSPASTTSSTLRSKRTTSTGSSFRTSASPTISPMRSASSAAMPRASPRRVPTICTTRRSCW